MSLLFTSDGHLLDLAIEAMLLDELESNEQRQIEAHVETCPACQRRLAAARAHSATPLPPLVGTEAKVERPAANNYRHFLWAAPTLLAAAALLLVVLPGDPSAPLDGPQSASLRPKGPRFTLEVYRETDAEPELLLDGQVVHAGDHIGYRVQLDQPAQLLLLGADSTGVVYPIWPPDGRSHEQPASDAPATLPRAIELDATPGLERMIGLACAEPVQAADIDFELVPESGQPPLLRVGCDQEVVRLTKEAP